MALECRGGSILPVERGTHVQLALSENTTGIPTGIRAVKAMYASTAPMETSETGRKRSGKDPQYLSRPKVAHHRRPSTPQVRHRLAVGLEATPLNGGAPPLGTLEPTAD
jgi:hypothetical protein